MKSDNTGNMPVIAYIAAFLIGVILFWSLGKNWLDLQSKAVFLAGLIGVAVYVILFGAWKIIRRSNDKEN